jgi:hypothetical protein
MTSRNLWIDSGMLSDVRAALPQSPSRRTAGTSLFPSVSQQAPNRKIAISSASWDRRQLGSWVESSVPVFLTLLQGSPCQGLALMEADSALRANSTNQTNGLWDTLELL